jgi:AcrR family transcriptional regulator
MATAPAPRIDGRNARRDRNSEAVLDAVNDLFTEGKLVPSVEEVAQRSGVSLRSVYRYFEDADELLRAAVARRVTLLADLFVLPEVGIGPIDERIARYVDHRLALYARLAPSVRAALLRAPHTPLIAEQIERRRRELLAQTEEHFAPELNRLGAAAGAATLACVDALCQFESVEHLRVRRRMSKARTRAALVQGLTALLAQR